MDTTRKSGFRSWIRSAEVHRHQWSVTVKRGRVHDSALSDAVPPGRVEAKVQRSKVLRATRPEYRSLASRMTCAAGGCPPRGWNTCIASESVFMRSDNDVVDRPINRKLFDLLTHPSDTCVTSVHRG